ncbi:MAG TPA: tRNA-dihydrouridine synthase, partial [Chthoniobacteraceae bacterium]
ASINATTTARILEDAGVQALAVHGRTKDQGYSGEADWDVIAQVVQAVSIPVIGNGDLTSAQDVARRMATGVRGVMIGRAAMSNPWIFSEIRHFLATGQTIAAPSLESQWAHILRHCSLAVQHRGAEVPTIHAMRARLMAYSRGMPEAKALRSRFSQVETLAGLEEIAAANIEHVRVHGVAELAEAAA